MIGKSMEQIELLADRVFVAVKAHIATSVGAITNLVGAITERLDEFEKRLRDVPAGPEGKSGAVGERGEQGKQGERGETGERGEIGRDGADGVIGKTGERGEKGEGATGDRGEVGLKGDVGERGADGLNAKDGASGERGEKGDSGIDGANGLPGENGQDGQPGQDGEKGMAGRDALQLDILSAIDETKVYARGTFAKHRGGLVRAVRNTDPVQEGACEKSGWEVVWDGIHEIGVEQGEDLRTFAIGMQLTSGKASVFKFSMPVQIYRKVWKKGAEYAPGDTVTWDGSTWHCNQNTGAEPGNSGEEWTLSNKRGANGKDGVSIKGEPGPVGKNGRDLTQMGPDGAKW